MFSKLVSRGSRRNRRENGLFFSSLLVSITAFYIILSLSRQDVMRFLREMESDAVNQLMALIPVFYGFTLILLFFLVYYASKFQLERRRHEFGVYRTLGMRRGQLFGLLLAEDLRGSAAALLLGLPAGILLSELISLVTSRLVGLGILGHQLTFSLPAIEGTVLGFLGIKLAAFLILSGKICRLEIGELLAEKPEGAQKQRPAILYGLAFGAGLLCLIPAYSLAIQGAAWDRLSVMALALGLGLLGTFLLFWGLRLPLDLAARRGNRHRQLSVFHFRQLQETVIRRSGSLAVCSLLLLAALCCFGAGTALFRHYGNSEPHVLDYTFDGAWTEGGGSGEIYRALEDYGLTSRFSALFDMQVGYPRTTEDYDNAFQMEPVLQALEALPASQDRDIFRENLQYASFPHLIALSGYNRLLSLAGLPELTLASGEAAVYMDRDWNRPEWVQWMDSILESRPEALLDGRSCRLTGPVQTTSLVTDRSLTLSFALILPDEDFRYFTQGDCSVYVNGILNRDNASGTSLMAAISAMNQELDATGLVYESYLQNMGRQLFYMVAASYITLYLAVIFLIMANTILGVQFLMGQRKATRRYRTLARLGAPYPVLCQSAARQVRWHFGLPAAVAAVSSLFGVRALFAGLLSSRIQGGIPEYLFTAGVMILALCVVEWVYMLAVRRSACRYLLALMEPEREE